MQPTISRQAVHTILEQIDNELLPLEVQAAERLEAEIQAVRERLASLHSTRDQLLRLVANYSADGSLDLFCGTASVSTAQGKYEKTHQPPNGKRQRLPGGATQELARRVLAERGIAMTKKEIADALKAEGQELPDSTLRLGLKRLESSGVVRHIGTTYMIITDEAAEKPGFREDKTDWFNGTQDSED